MPCRLTGTHDDPLGRTMLWTCDAPWEWAPLLTRLAHADERQLAVRMMAEAFRHLHPAEQPGAVQRWTQQNVRYVPDDPPTRLLAWLEALNAGKPGDPFERFKSPELTLATGEGDCDDSARLVRAILRALGHDARLAFFGTSKAPQHVAAYLDTEDGQRIWLEATIPAALGEHPYTAKARIDAAHSAKR